MIRYIRNKLKTYLRIDYISSRIDTLFMSSFITVGKNIKSKYPYTAYPMESVPVNLILEELISHMNLEVEWDSKKLKVKINKRERKNEI